MNIISWNCRGLGNLRTVHDLCRMVKEKRPSMVFLMETKLRKVKMEVIRYKLGFSNLFVVDCVGKSGGLALLWGDDVVVDIQNYSQRHINGIIQSPNSNVQWKLTGFYGHPEVTKRHEAWELLKVLSRLPPTPWICIGDFNEVISNAEKWGGSSRSSNHMRLFQVALEDCELSDLGFRGPKYTWSNCRDGSEFIKERLDRGVANVAWRELFPDVEVRVEVSTNSDHAVLILSLIRQQRGNYKYRRFRYEASWALDRRYKTKINQVWSASTSLGCSWDAINLKLSRCKKESLQWQQEIRGSTQDTIGHLRDKLNLLQGREDEVAVNDIKLVKQNLQLLLDQEDLKWKQRAKAEWLKNGDRNTKYYHACANYRRNLNQISTIKDEQGVLWNSFDDVGRAFVNYFLDLFTASPVGNMEPCLAHLEERVSSHMNDELLQPFTREEVGYALHQMAPLKAPGPDGFPAGFFQHHWETMGNEW
ncbi:uncharacterized protein LOC132165159 [Corylus avellana]|uniref:uncharacterized protein LOC132165159 n=1 Tax=Corylus avellana TaxID=13451 RepID=UPI00286AB719|nr:uncharacterized protein LOC132165159 [Corylus avellana]